MATFVDRLDALDGLLHSVIPWSCPVPFFGRLDLARAATVGINPSNREFMNLRGDQLLDSEQRLPTLASLGLSQWSEATSSHLRDIICGCSMYFVRNPYDRWFGVLEQILAPAGLTFYGSEPTACHVDLFPFATADKWGSLPSFEQRRLLHANADALGRLIATSRVRLLILNGQSVVSNFEVLTDIQLSRSVIDSWGLPRSNGSHVPGLAYEGEVHTLGGVHLPRPLRVLGYNHNLQSSFGVTSAVVSRIGQWVRTALTSEHELNA